MNIGTSALLSRLSNAITVTAESDSISVLRSVDRKLQWLRRMSVIAGVSVFLIVININGFADSASRVVLAPVGVDHDLIGKYLVSLYGGTSVAGVTSALAGTLFGCLIWLQVTFHDPLSNNVLLREISKSPDTYPKDIIDRTILRPLANDRKKYAELLPSHKLERLCRACDQSKICTNRITGEEDFFDRFSFLVWRKVYYSGSIEPDLLARLASAVLRCRLLYYIRVISLNMAYLLALIVGLHWVIDNNLGQHTQNMVAALAFPLMFIGVAEFLGMQNSATGGTAESGVWAKLKGASDNVANVVNASDGYGEAYKEYVCKIAGGGCSYKRPDAVTIHPFSQLHAKLLSCLLDHLDVLVLSKLKLFASGQVETSANPYVDLVRKSIQSFYEAYFPQGGLLVCRKLHELKLEPYFVVTNTVSKLDDIATRTMGEDGCFVYNRNATVAGLQLCDGIGSLLVVPIGMKQAYREDLVASIDRASRSRHESEFGNHGWLLLTAEHMDLFSKSSAPIHIQLIAPFIHRIVFEHIRHILFSKRSKR